MSKWKNVKTGKYVVSSTASLVLTFCGSWVWAAVLFFSGVWATTAEAAAWGLVKLVVGVIIWSIISTLLCSKWIPYESDAKPGYNPDGSEKDYADMTQSEFIVAYARENGFRPNIEKPFRSYPDPGEAVFDSTGEDIIGSMTKKDIRDLEGESFKEYLADWREAWLNSGDPGELVFSVLDWKYSRK